VGENAPSMDRSEFALLCLITKEKVKGVNIDEKLIVGLLEELILLFIVFIFVALFLTVADLF
jgi:hypothetical protein